MPESVPVGMPNRELGSSEGPAVVGYTAGVFDLFHIGHLNLLRNARERCDLLVAGVTTDELAEEVRGERPIVPFLERMEIIQSVRYVDRAVPQTTMDKLETWLALKFDVLFVGDNVRSRTDWKAIEDAMANVGVGIVYLPATHVASGALLARSAKDLVVD